MGEIDFPTLHGVSLYSHTHYAFYVDIVVFIVGFLGNSSVLYVLIQVSFYESINGMSSIMGVKSNIPGNKNFLFLHWFSIPGGGEAAWPKLYTPARTAI